MINEEATKMLQEFQQEENLYLEELIISQMLIEEANSTATTGDERKV